MSLFNNIHFLQDHGDDERRPNASSYAQGYGNRVASARVFAPLGHRRESRTRNDGAGARMSRCVTLPRAAGACG